MLDGANFTQRPPGSLPSKALRTLQPLWEAGPVPAAGGRQREQQLQLPQQQHGGDRGGGQHGQLPAWGEGVADDHQEHHGDQLPLLPRTEEVRSLN